MSCIDAFINHLKEEQDDYGKIVLPNAAIFFQYKSQYTKQGKI